MIKTCPNCNKQFTVGFDCTDVIHPCGEQIEVTETLKQEDVTVVGDWEDESGQGTKSPQEVMRQGMENELWGTRAGIEGEQKEALTRRGVRTSTHRQRQHLEFINIKKEGLN